MPEKLRPVDYYEWTKSQVETVSEAKYENENLLREWCYSGMTFHTPNGTVCDDIEDNNTTLIQNYGTFETVHAMDPKSTNVALYCNEAIMGNKGGEKQTGFVALFDAPGNETSRHNLERIHMERYQIGPFDSKSKRPILQRSIWRLEKLTRA